MIERFLPFSRWLLSGVSAALLLYGYLYLALLCFDAEMSILGVLLALILLAILIFSVAINLCFFLRKKLSDCHSLPLSLHLPVPVSSRAGRCNIKTLPLKVHFQLRF